MRHTAAGFTLVELMIVMVIAGILAGISLANLSQPWGNERLNVISRTLAAWLDEHRRLAMQQGGTCGLRIDPTNASLLPGATALDINGQTTTNVCAGRAPLRLRAISTNTNSLQLQTTPAASNQILFSFRGLSTSRANSSSSEDSELELKLTLPNLPRSRCVRLVNPLGLIRQGWANGDGPCTYQSAF